MPGLSLVFFLPYVPPQKVGYLTKKSFSRENKNTLVGIDERDRLPHSILKSYGWKSRIKGNNLTFKTRFLTDIFINFKYFQKQKKANGKLQELSKSGETFGIDR